MNPDCLIEKLLAAARATPADERVPYAFEQRIMARLRSTAAWDRWSVWEHALWRSARLCLLILLGSGLWWVWSEQDSPDFSQEFQHAVFAQATQVDDSE